MLKIYNKAAEEKKIMRLSVSRQNDFSRGWL